MTGDLPSIESLQRRIRVARGEEAGDLLLRGGQVVNVFTGRVERGDVVVADGFIAGVGGFRWEARETVPIEGRVVLPGLIDSHMHLESTLLTPAELARLIVPHGTTATISDSHEIGNVLGVPGIEMLIEASAGLPFDLFFMASSCVPATRWEHAGAVLGPAEVAALLRHPRVLGLAEMMDMPAVLAGDLVVLEKIRAAGSLPIDGHSPAMTGRDLLAYISAGIRSDHESETVEEARQKAAWGMLVQVREGSIAQNLDAMLPLLKSGELGDRWTLVTDDVLPGDLQEQGHIEDRLHRLVAGGVPAATAVRQATWTPAQHYRLFDRGAVAPGYRADLVVVEDLRDFRPGLVLKDGRIVARDGRFLPELHPAAIPAANTIHIAPLDASAFGLPIRSDSGPVIRPIPGKLANVAETQPLHRQDGFWTFDPQRDVQLIASIERHRATGNVGLGLVAGFGLRDGALGSSVAHDSHNLIVTGTNARDMLACVRALQEQGGGFVVAQGGEIRARVPLPIAGLLSRESADTVARQLREAESAAAALGCRMAGPFGVLSFLALPVIPELRITDQGLWDVTRQQFLSL